LHTNVGQTLSSVNPASSYGLRGPDKRVPPPNAFELYQALQDRKAPVKLILYKGFGHPINKPKQQRAVMELQLRWVQ
jgi:dipeptidyl aminopeptidase/acylaminoacyl peptidase